MTTDFQLRLISPEDSHPGELAVLPALFANGLAHYHLRKPAWTRRRLVAHLEAIPAQYYPRITLHTHHELAANYAIGALHDRGGRQSAVGQQLPQQTALPRSRPVHSPAELRDALAARAHAALLVSPVFQSISKPFHNNDKLPRSELRALLKRPRQAAVIALGGITPERLAEIAGFGFDGAAILGAVWLAPDPAAAWRRFTDKLPSLQSIFHQQTT
jgi:thiamine-phosphate pyrophosphorylase